ncbi:carbonic anhydrase-related protein 10-like isoform X2 [Brevipalpus obovatus]|uniref:carbonic anhydrase-related protein 10-like isoform X2 n=1 Tax=Brevipalpus obovatus TaxID=246614 RepID=UPI003D9DD0E5
MGRQKIFFSILILCTIEFKTVFANWDYWWTYDGISGPNFWGLLNPEWYLCSKGRRQSPINILPSMLMYDSNLRPLYLDKHRISGSLINNGHGIVFQADEETESKSDESKETNSVRLEVSRKQVPINISGGPLSYSYTFSSMYIHFGRSDEYGSEHFIDNVSFPAELQMIGYNSDLYHNISEASNKANGLVGIALLAQVGSELNKELRLFTSLAQHVRYRGQNITIKSISIRDLIPDLAHFMTYEGSLTIPLCQETITWIIINKPTTISKQQLHILRKLMQGETDAPKAPLGNNFRPLQPFNSRFVRTNIDFKRKPGQECPTLKRNMHYQVNPKHVRK